MKRIVIAAALFAVTVSGPAFADVVIDDNDQTVTVDCAKDPNVSISGNKAVVTLTGACAAISVDGNDIKLTGSAKLVSVNGNKNTVKLDQVDALSINGNENVVTYKRPLTAKKAKVANVGNKNKLAKVK